MNSKGNYYAGNLACQNLGDCSLCELTIMLEDTKEELLNKSENKKTKKTISLKELLKKFNPESAA